MFGSTVSEIGVALHPGVFNMCLPVCLAGSAVFPLPSSLFPGKATESIRSVLKIDDRGAKWRQRPLLSYRSLINDYHLSQCFRYRAIALSRR